MIFEHASIRDVKPKKVLRYWFEKKEVKELIEKLAADHPNGPAARVVYNDGYEEEESESEDELDQDNEVNEDEEDEENEEDQDEEDQDEQDHDEDEDEDEDEDQSADQDHEDEVEVLGEQDQDAVGDEADIDEEMRDPVNTEAEAVLDSAVQTVQTEAAAISGEAVEVTTTEKNDTTVTADHKEPDQDMSDSPAVEAQVEPASTAACQNEDEQEEVQVDEQLQDSGNADAGNQDDDGQDTEDQDAEDHVAEDEDDAMANEDDIAVAAAAAQTTPPPPPAPVVRPHRKWRHIPKFVRITQCPPPVELFLICKQLNEEAKSWFYNVAVLKIDATASFSHFSFFEVALDQIADAAFSPMENIRKAEVTFVWDTTWIRAESTGYAASVFSFFLQSRADYVLKILKQAPDLEQLVIHWHDSAEDEEAQGLMQEILEKFVCNLQATIDTKAHIIASDSKPHSRSIAGKRRLEFQGIVDHPPEAF